MRRCLLIVSAIALVWGMATGMATPVGAQTEGAEFCDVFGTLLGEDGQAQCEGAGGNQIPLQEVTTPTCEAVDTILTEVEGGGGEALAGPVRQVFTDTGVCTFAAQPEEAPTTTAPTTAPAPTDAPAPTLPVTGSRSGSGVSAALVGLVGIALAAAVGALRRLGHTS